MKLDPAGFELSSEDWCTIVKLVRILKIFDSHTTYLCASRYSTTQAQLPFYTVLLRQLNTIKDEEEYDNPPPLFEACCQACEILNNYWQKIDTHSSQAISFILDPRCKMEAFGWTGLFWRDSWIQNARDDFERVFQTQYATCNILNHSLMPAESYSLPKSSGEEDLYIHSIFGSEAGTPSRNPSFKTSQYLLLPINDRRVNPSVWWKLNCYRFPVLSCMAGDILSIPATSVPAEQLFSRAGDIISKRSN